MEVVTIVGTRPEFTKAYLVSQSLKKKKIEEYVIHTGQHYDNKLSRDIFNDVGFREPDINLNIGSGTHGWQTGKMLIGLEKILIENKPDAVIVYGDTNSALAGALTAAKLNIPVLHIEAGARSFNKEMPEEINRIIVDHLATINCCATKRNLLQLNKEGISIGAIFTGDVMLDLIENFKDRVLMPRLVFPKSFFLATIHRAENTDSNERLSEIFSWLGKIGDRVVFPIHPRTKEKLKRFKIKLPENIILISPVSYREMLWLEMHAQKIITDSGGVQKEAYWLGVPCLTFRRETEWTETLKGEWNQLITSEEHLQKGLKIKPKGKPDVALFGNGKAVQKVVAEVIKLVK
ncbi:UDP-N-acetylglucosamine 2-epimerase (non-hydrolyzing) [Candidatus Collierbacteria bacterium]|nr:UDP-N-acetylglucosamine 2-epimerase (non-hydrolyzing) [Candidatus Collierbacteria bacterium]